MRLAECEADTICNLGKGLKMIGDELKIYCLFLLLHFKQTNTSARAQTSCVADILLTWNSFQSPSEKENFKLSDLLSHAEERLKIEKEKYKALETSHLVTVYWHFLIIIWTKIAETSRRKECRCERCQGESNSGV